jgi:hypothetical protein
VALAGTDISKEHIASISSANGPSSQIIVTLMEAIRSSEMSVLQEPHGVTFQKTAFFIVTAVKTSSLT